MKLLILTTDKSVLTWKTLDDKVTVIKETLNKVKNGSWEIEVRYQDLKPVVTPEGRLDKAWFDSISYPLFKADNEFVGIHFNIKDWKKLNLKSSLRGSNQVDVDYVGEFYFKADENTKRGNKLDQFIQVVLHEIWHELCRSCGVKDDLHSWHKDNIDITKADWSIFDLNNWQKTYQAELKQEVSRLTTMLGALKAMIKPTPSLQPLVERKAKAVLEEMKLMGHEMRITQGYRSIEEQNKLYAQGRTTPGSIVTNAKGGQSFHNYGVAVDFVFRKEGYSASNSLWQTFGAIGKKHGFEWGGDWTSFIDRPHLEIKLGYTLKDFQDGKVDYSKFK